MIPDARRALLLLGGSRQQVVAIEVARKCGYRTVLCDYLEDNPGRHYADSFHLVSTVDREAVLEVARREEVEGVIAYSSDPASPTAAYVAERLGMLTNPLAAVEIMSTKSLFRRHLHEVGLPCPLAASFEAGASAAEVECLVEGFRWPLVVKPTDSSGSKGVSVVTEPTQMPAALEHAGANSRNGILIAEEYIERAFPNVVGGDIFVVDGMIRFWGLMRCLRDSKASLVPVGKAIPSGLSEGQLSKVKETLQLLVSSLGIRFGELNVEVIIGDGDVPYVLELGSRAGGNMIPVQLGDASGIDLVRANVMCAMGDDPGGISWDPEDVYFATHVLHTLKDGTYEGYELSAAAEVACYREVVYQEAGAPVHHFDGANKALGILFFEFEKQESFEDYIANTSNHVRVMVDSSTDGRK
ncbi:hypothetical protein C1878_03840 [Gordonibacter sp. 28C]|nr:hypothetical protein C1878_03840 [Gordonibacter sp. 28C]